MSKPKPVAGPDNLLLLLVQHWACDESVFSTEDDCYDMAIIILFQSYTDSRPAEFVHLSKDKASQDLLGEAEDAKCKPSQKAKDRDYDNESDIGDDPEYDDNDLEDDNDADDKDTDETADHNSGYNTDEIEVTMTENTDICYNTKIDKFREPVQQDCDTELDKFEEMIQKYKTLCYKDICLWIVQNPKQRERDILIIEVYLQYYKGVDNKSKLYVVLL
jgi:hypothetical protein